MAKDTRTRTIGRQYPIYEQSNGAILRESKSLQLESVVERNSMSMHWQPLPSAGILRGLDEYGVFTSG